MVPAVDIWDCLPTVSVVCFVHEDNLFQSFESYASEESREGICDLSLDAIEVSNQRVAAVLVLTCRQGRSGHCREQLSYWRHVRPHQKRHSRAEQKVLGMVATLMDALSQRIPQLLHLLLRNV